MQLLSKVHTLVSCLVPPSLCELKHTDVAAVVILRQGKTIVLVVRRDHWIGTNKKRFQAIGDRLQRRENEFGFSFIALEQISCV